MSFSDYLSIVALAISLVSLGALIYFRLKLKDHNKLMREKTDNGLKLANDAINNSKGIRFTLDEITKKVEHSLNQSQEAIETSKDSIELTLNAEINQSRYKVLDAAKALSDFRLKHPKKDSSDREQFFSSAIENMLNQYESACEYYLSGRINKNRFEKQMHLEIKRIVEDKATKKYFTNTLTSSYKAIIEVYKELNKV
ncbi:MAG: hypothetical protein KDC69_08100 [Flavobacteriaceae bacterium]|nr:hypothetical protein [Flavobacteriaceae bacterium]